MSEESVRDKGRLRGRLLGENALEKLIGQGAEGLRCAVQPP